MLELICGFLERSGGFQTASGDSLEESVREMAACLGYGRPFSLDIWAGGPVALGRVSVASGDSPPPAPRLHRCGSVVAAADMRLPAWPQDRAAHDALFRSFAAPGFPNPLDGDFALAVWDGSRSELTLARDRLGIRPLFLARTRSGGIAFASFPDALIDSGIVEGRFQPTTFAAMLFENPPADAKTWIEGIERVPPGHVMTLGLEGEHIRRYWRYPLGRRSEVPDDHARAAKALRCELEAAVNRVLPARGAVCTHLSGGLDSGAVTALSSRLAGVPPAEVTTYCVTMPESDRHLGPVDEEPTARAVARKAGVTLVTFPFDAVPDMLLNPLSRTFHTADNPGFAYRRIIADAAGRGADRILCGFGGDEVVSYSGEGALLADLLTLRWRSLLRTAREISGPLWRTLARQAAADLLPPRAEQLLRGLLGKTDRVRALGHLAVHPAFRPSGGWAPSVGAERKQRAWLECHAFQHRLERQAWQAAQHGLRYVFPLLDWRLIEFGAGLSARLQLHAGMHRALFRTAVADLLPPESLARRSKLSPTPSLLYQLARRRADLIAEARRVSESSAASAVIDLAEIERQLAALPEPEAVAATIRADAAQGRQTRDPQQVLIIPFRLARALAQNEAECAQRAASRPRAVNPVA